MLVFYYDHTFEGLLTAIFDAYSRKTFPDYLYEEGAPVPLFVDETYTVVTESTKANRVWAGLQKKMTKNACNMLYYAWLAEQVETDNLLIRFIRKAFDSPVSIETNFADPDVLGVKQIAQKVSHERTYLMEFVRFQKAADGIYFAPVSPKYNALPLAIAHFKDRFADQKWLIYDVRRRYGYYYDCKTVDEVTFEDDAHLLQGKLDESLLAADEKQFQSMWKDYFKAMTIRERINPKLHRRNLPPRFWKFLTEKQ